MKFQYKSVPFFVIASFALCLFCSQYILAQDESSALQNEADQNQETDVVQQEFSDLIADYHCNYFFGEMSLWRVETYYDTDDKPAVRVYIYTRNLSEIEEGEIIREIRDARKEFNAAAETIRREGKENPEKLTAARKLLRESLSRIQQEDRFVSIYVSASKTHSPVIEWRKGLPESLTFRSEFRNWFRTDNGFLPQEERFYYLGPLDIVYQGISSGVSKYYVYTDSANKLEIKKKDFKEQAFRRDWSKVAPTDQRLAANKDAIDNAWEFFDQVQQGTAPPGLASAPTLRMISEVPDFLQVEFGHIFQSGNCCVVMAFGDVAGYWDTNNYAGIRYWNLFPATWQMGITYPLGGFWQDQGNPAVDNTLYQIAIEMQYDFNNGGVTHSCMDPLDVRFEHFTNSSPGRYLSFDTVEDCWYGPAWWITVQDEINNYRPMVLRTTHFTWYSHPGEPLEAYPEMGGHAVVLYGYDTEKGGGYSQAICVHVNGTGSPGDVWWDYPEMVNCMTWRIYPGGNPGEFLHAPITTYPSNGGSITDTTPRLDWDPRSGASMYSIQVSANSNFSGLIENDVTTNTYYDVSALSCGTYYWRVASHNSNGYICEYHDPAKTFTVVPPDAPYLNDPVDAVCSGTSYSLSWSPETGANNYTIQEATNSSFTSGLVEYPAPGTSYQFNHTVSRPVPFYYRVRSNGDCGNSGWSNTRSVQVINFPDTPPLDNPESPNCSGDNYVVSWGSVAGATSYTIQEADNPGFDYPSNEIITTQLYWLFSHNISSPKTYYYRVRANNSCGSSNWSPVKSTIINPKPGTPSLNNPTSPVCSGTNYSLSWSSVSYADNYTIQEATNPSFSGAASYNTPGTSYQFNHTVSSPTPYYYRVRANNGCGSGSWSNTRTVDVLPVPSPPSINDPTTPVCSASSYSISWNSVPNANDYTIQEATNSSFTSGLVEHTTGSTSYSYSHSVGSSTPYFYRVRTNGDCGSSVWSPFKQVEVITGPSAPSLNQPTSPVCSGDNYTVSWGSVGSAEDYTIQEATDSSFTSNLIEHTTGSTSYQYNHSVGSVTTYYYRVRANNQCGNSGWSSTRSVKIRVPPSTPTLNCPPSPACTASVVTINLPIISDADSIIIELASNPSFTGATQYTASASAGSYDLTMSGTPGTYYLRIRAENDCGASDWSNVCTIVVMAGPTAPTLNDPTSPVCAGDPYTITWSASQGADNYTIQEATNSSFTSGLVEHITSSTSYQYNHSVSTSTTYYYRVRANSECGGSEWSDTKSVEVRPVPSTPVLYDPGSPVCSEDDYTITWPAVEGADSYRIQEATNTSFTQGFEEYQTQNTSWSRNHPVSSTTTYYYRMKAGNDCGESAWSLSLKSVEVRSAPAKPSISSPGSPQFSGADYSVSWSAVAGINDYTIQEATNSSFTSDLVEHTTSSTSQTYNHIVSTQTTFYYQVRANNDCGSGDWSDWISLQVQTLGIPSINPSPAQANTDTDYAVSWSLSPDPQGYVIQEATDPNFTQDLVEHPVSGTSYTFNHTVTIDTDYFYRVRGKTDNDQGAWSNSHTVKVKYYIPDCEVRVSSEISSGEPVTFTVSLNGSECGPCDAFGLDVSYDTSLLTFSSCTKGGLVPDSWTFDYSVLPGGFVRIGTYGAGQFSGSGVIAELTFAVSPNCKEGDTCQLCPQNLTDCLQGLQTVCGTFTVYECICNCDLNGDGQVTPGDALIPFKHYLELELITDECTLECADANCDGQITPGDALIILKVYLGLMECPDCHN